MDFRFEKIKCSVSAKFNDALCEELKDSLIDDASNLIECEVVDGKIELYPGFMVEVDDGTDLIIAKIIAKNLISGYVNLKCIDIKQNVWNFEITPNEIEVCKNKTIWREFEKYKVKNYNEIGNRTFGTNSCDARLDIFDEDNKFVEKIDLKCEEIISKYEETKDETLKKEVEFIKDMLEEFLYLDFMISEANEKEIVFDFDGDPYYEIPQKLVDFIALYSDKKYSIEFVVWDSDYSEDNIKIDIEPNSVTLYQMVEDLVCDKIVLDNENETPKEESETKQNYIIIGIEQTLYLENFKKEDFQKVRQAEIEKIKKLFAEILEVDEKEIVVKDDTDLSNVEYMFDYDESDKNLIKSYEEESPNIAMLVPIKGLSPYDIDEKLLDDRLDVFPVLFNINGEWVYQRYSWGEYDTGYFNIGGEEYYLGEGTTIYDGLLEKFKDYIDD